MERKNDGLYRTRIISFRATPEEYDSLQRHTQSLGARSVSEYARSVACREAPENDAPSNPQKLDLALESLHETVASLERRIEQLTQILVKRNE